MSIQYRFITSDDNAELASVIRTVFREFKIDRPGTVYTDPTTDHLFELFDEYKNSGASYTLASDGTKLIGGCGIFPTPGLPKDHVELVKFYLLDSYRGLGIGKALMLQNIELAKEFGFKFVYLESLPELSKAVGMYEQIGFKHIPERLGNSGHFACNVLMLKTL